VTLPRREGRAASRPSRRFVCAPPTRSTTEGVALMPSAKHLLATFLITAVSVAIIFRVAAIKNIVVG